MAYRCDPDLLRAMQEHGQTIRLPNVSCADDDLGGKERTLGEGPTVVCLARPLSAEEIDWHERHDVRADFIVYLPLTDSDGNELSVMLDGMTEILKPDSITGYYSIVGFKNALPVESSDGNGEHLEILVRKA